MPPHEADPPELTAQLTVESTNAFIRPAVWAGILRARVLRRDITTLVESWRSEIDPVLPDAADEVTLCYTFSCMAVGELSTILKNPQETIERRVLAAVLLLGRDDTSPLDALYAQVVLVDRIKEYEIMWGKVTEESFDTLVRRDWLRLSNQRFLLRNPTPHVFAIRKACESASWRWSAAAKIILAAIPTVNLKLPESSWQKTLLH